MKADIVLVSLGLESSVRPKQLTTVDCRKTPYLLKAGGRSTAEVQIEIHRNLRRPSEIPQQLPANACHIESTTAAPPHLRISADPVGLFYLCLFVLVIVLVSY